MPFRSSLYLPFFVDTCMFLDCMAVFRKVGPQGFFASHPVFTREQFGEFLGPRLTPAGLTARLSYYSRTGCIRSIARSVYAVVPYGRSPDSVKPDPFLVASALRPDAIFSHHSALELLGAAHSVWSMCTVFSAGTRLALDLNGSEIRTAPHPRALSDANELLLGVHTMEWRGVMLRTTGPERTLVEGFRQPHLAGGTEELVVSASGFPTIDLPLLMRILDLYSIQRLHAAVGWFLETYASAFGVTEGHLAAIEHRRPHSPQYLVRTSRGGRLVPRWNLVLPPGVGKDGTDAGEP